MTKVNEKAVTMLPETKKLLLAFFEKFDGEFIESTLYELLQYWMSQDEGFEQKQNEIANATFFITETCMMLRRLDKFCSVDRSSFQPAIDLFEFFNYNELEDNLHTILQAYISPDTNYSFEPPFMSEMIYMLRLLIKALYNCELLVVGELGLMFKTA